MAEPASNPKIDKLRFQLKADPKSRIFFPLAEELRKAGQLTESEQVLRVGLANHPTYLSAWVSLGRTLRDLQKHADAAEALNKALQIDPGNVVAARLLAEAYVSLGEKVEAIKKYKLVHALLPGDEDLEGIIQRLDAEINAPLAIPEPAQFAAPPAAAEESPFAPEITHPGERTTPFGQTLPVFEEEEKEKREEIATGDAVPMRAAHEESPFEEPAVPGGYGSDAFDVEHPSGMQVTSAPLAAEVPEPLPTSAPGAAEEADVFEPAAPGVEDFAKTITMADLYASQGLVDEARDIYEGILARDPSNAAVRAKLEALQPSPGPASAKVDKLQKWLSRVKSKEVGSV